VPPHCIPIHANVSTYDWHSLAKALQFDVIMMDPPWALATANPTRGAAMYTIYWRLAQTISR
jgi:mRNA m6A methyltransferase catalytic subunit